MGDLTSKFTALEEQLSTADAALQVDLNAIRDTLDLLNTAIDTLNNNQATNTRYLLSAIGQNSPCAPCPTPSIVVPPVDTTPRTVNEDRCKRSQAILQFLAAVFEAFDNLMNLNVTGAWTLINDVFSQIIATMGAGDTIPLPSFPEAVNIAGNFFSFAAGRLFSGENISELFAGLRDTMEGAIFFSTTSEDAQSAYNAIIDASAYSNEGKLLLKSTAYSAIWSYFLDPATDPDLTGFSGTACGGSLAGITSCTDFDAVPATADGADWYAIQVPVAFPGEDNDFMIAGDYFGWTVELLYVGTGRSIRGRYVSLAGVNEAEFLLAVGAETNEFIHHTQAIAIYTNDHDAGAEPFGVRICPPAE
jgi:hypothetical protein